MWANEFYILLGRGDRFNSKKATKNTDTKQWISSNNKNALKKYTIKNIDKTA